MTALLNFMKSLSQTSLPTLASLIPSSTQILISSLTQILISSLTPDIDIVMSTNNIITKYGLVSSLYFFFCNKPFTCGIKWVPSGNKFGIWNLRLHRDTVNQTSLAFNIPPPPPTPLGLKPIYKKRKKKNVRKIQTLPLLVST